jgi:hypothetical protein
MGRTGRIADLNNSHNGFQTSSQDFDQAWTLDALGNCEFGDTMKERGSPRKVRLGAL